MVAPASPSPLDRGTARTLRIVTSSLAYRHNGSLRYDGCIWHDSYFCGPTKVNSWAVSHGAPREFTSEAKNGRRTKPPGGKRN